MKRLEIVSFELQIQLQLHLETYIICNLYSVYASYLHSISVVCTQYMPHIYTVCYFYKIISHFFT